jgi:hypothetical protein
MLENWMHHTKPKQKKRMKKNNFKSQRTSQKEVRKVRN